MKTSKLKTSASNLQNQNTQESKPPFKSEEEAMFFKEAPTAVQRKPFFSPENNKTDHSSINGNFFTPTHVQPKLTIGQPNDKYEQEADAMAENVVGQIHSPTVQSKCAECEQEESEAPTLGQSDQSELQRKPIFESEEDSPGDAAVQRKCESSGKDLEGTVQTKSTDTHTASSNISEQINSTKGKGNSLPSTTKNNMESAFGADFSTVNIHDNREASAMNKDLNAQAFTHGSDIYFNEGKYQPGTTEGDELLAHELTHTIQQSSDSKIQRKANKEEEKPSVENPKTTSPDNADSKVKEPQALKDDKQDSEAPKEGMDQADNKAVNELPGMPDEAGKPDAKNPKEKEGKQKEAQPAKDDSASKEKGKEKADAKNVNVAQAQPAPAPAPPADLETSLSFTPSTNLEIYAESSLAKLKAIANTQIKSVQDSAVAGRAAIGQLFAKAQLEADQKIGSTKNNLEVLFQTKQQEASSKQVAESTRLSTDGANRKKQINEEKENAQVKGTSITESQSENASTQLGGKAEEAKQEGETKANGESGDILSGLKQISFGQLGSKIAETISGVISDVVSGIGSFIQKAVSVVMEQLGQVLQALDSILSSALSMLQQFFHTITSSLQSVKANLMNKLTSLSQGLLGGIMESRESVLLRITEAESNTINQIQDLLSGAVETIDTVLVENGSGEDLGEDETDDEDQERADQEHLYAAIDQFTGDVQGALEEVGGSFGTFVEQQKQKVQTSILDSMSSLSSKIGLFASQFIAQINSWIGFFGQALGSIGSLVMGIFGSIISITQPIVSSFFSDTEDQVSGTVDEAVGVAGESAHSSEAYNEAGSGTSSWFSSISMSDLASNIGSVISSTLGLQRKEDDSSFLGGVGSELWDTVKSLFLLVVAGIVVAALYFIPVVGPILSLIGGIALALFILWGLLKPFFEIWDRMTASGDPLWVKIVFVIPLGLAELIGLLPLLEGIFGFDWISGETLTKEERGRRITRGIIDLALTFLTVGIGKAIKAGATGAKGAGRAARGAKGARLVRWLDDAIEFFRKAFKKKKKKDPPKKSPKDVIRDVNLKERIKQSGMSTKQAGQFFGWGKGTPTKTVKDFTRPMLEQNGWTREIIASVADGYRRIGEVSPTNPSALPRAAQLESLLTLF